MKIIPAIDIIDGKCVRLSQGDYASKKIYSENPLSIAKDFENHQISHLHLVDLDGAKSKKVINIEVLQSIAKATNLHIDFGGGVKSENDLKKVLDAGAKQVTAGSIAVKEPNTVKDWIKKYGSEKIILGADVKDQKIAINGWQEESEIIIFDFLKEFYSVGIRYVICTDISKDGMLQGASVDLYKQILRRFPDLQLIASGGVSNMDDLHELKSVGLYGAIVGKAVYEGNISLKEIESFNKMQENAE
jgi:phosphoribosylformimino-5-aminoimidazole carboxamide ribotide isomerase